MHNFLASFVATASEVKYRVTVSAGVMCWQALTPRGA